MANSIEYIKCNVCRTYKISDFYHKNGRILKSCNDCREYSNNRYKIKKQRDSIVCEPGKKVCKSCNIIKVSEKSLYFPKCFICHKFPKKKENKKKKHVKFLCEVCECYISIRAKEKHQYSKKHVTNLNKPI